MMYLRVFLGFLIILSIYLFPWWVSVLFILVLVARFRAPEVVLYGFMIDALYAVPHAFNFYFWGFVSTLLLFFVVEYIKKKILV